MHGKIKILFLPGEALSMTNDAQFSTGVGLIVWVHADIDKQIIGGDAVTDSSKEYCYARLGHLFDIEECNTPRVQQIIEKKFQAAYTRWRHELHVAYRSLQEKDIPSRSLSPRKDVTLEKWQLACDFIEDEIFWMLFNQTTGRMAFLSRLKKMEEKSEIEFFKETRVSKKEVGEFVNEAAKLKYDEMVAMKNKCAENEGETLQESEIVKSALGHKSGYVKGMGHGLQVSRGLSNIAAGIQITKKLSELDSANEQI
ncbi:hypothetical protein OROGR_023372 [Orobanche gracilis]